MNRCIERWGVLLLGVAIQLAAANPVATPGNSPTAPSNPTSASVAGKGSRDGRHDFDFNTGVWHTEIRRVLNPLDGGDRFIDMQGTVSVRGVWAGRAQLEEIEADGPKGHWEGLTLFLYNPAAHQWSQTFAGSKSGRTVTPLVGGFSDGRGMLYSSDTLDGRAILVRGVWSDITPRTHRYEEDYSADGGASWSPAFIARLTRQAQVAPPPSLDGQATTAAGGQHGFDFDIGTWKTHTRRLVKPLSGASEWIAMDGVTVVRPVWGGKANLAELESDGPKGHLQLLALRLYDAAAGQWNLSFATSGVGILNATGDAAGVPEIGRFENGVGTFYDQEEFDGRTIWVRFTFRSLTPTTARSEQAFSDDNGKSWETNWINEYQRMADAG